MSLIKKNFIINSLLLVFSLLLGLFFSEIFLRVYLSNTNQLSYNVEEKNPYTKKHDYLSHVYETDMDYNHDINGYHNPDSVLDEYDIVALGDSHTHGELYNFSNTWPKNLSGMLDKTVYNMGVHGYGTAQYYYLIDQALSFKPKLVVMGLYLGNDIFNAYDLVYQNDLWKDYRLNGFVNDKPYAVGELKKMNTPFKSLRDWMRSKSALYQFFGNRTRKFREKAGISSPREVGTSDWTTNDPDASLLFDDQEIKTLFWVGSRIKGIDLENKNIEEGLRLSLNFLDLINQKASSSNVKLLVALMPTKETVYVSKTEKMAQDNAYYKKILINEKEIKKRILDACAEKGILCFDMLPGMQQALLDGVKLYKEDWDEHPDNSGYKQYARTIADYINKNNILE